MPTRFTGIVRELMHIGCMRKACLHSMPIDDGVSWEYIRVLRHIEYHPGCMQTDISKSLKVTAAAVTQSTQKLENAGMIEKKIDSTNLRVKKMYITDKGAEALKKGTRIFDMVDGIMFDGFSDEELVQLEDMLKKMGGNMSEYLADAENKSMGV